MGDPMEKISTVQRLPKPEWLEPTTAAKASVVMDAAIAKSNAMNATMPTMPKTSRSLLDIVKSDVTLLEKKQHDYANSDDQWKNFREAAEFVRKTRGVEFEALDGAYYLLGLKISRMKNLGKRDAANESRLDTLQDLRGYSAIIQAIEEEEAALNAAGGSMPTFNVDKFAGLVKELKENIAEYERAEMTRVCNDPDIEDSIGLCDDDDDDDHGKDALYDADEIESIRSTVAECAIGDVAVMVHGMACDKGWWDDVDVNGRGDMLPTVDQIAGKLLMIHAEVSEAAEELRRTPLNAINDEKFEDFDKPAGFGVELADIIIRVLDLSEAMGIDITAALASKIVYNRSRGYRHGGLAV